GLGIVGELSGVVPSPQWKKQQFARAEDQVWFPGETINTGVGQGYVLVTPIQLASAVATMAARGARFKPRLLIGTKDAVTGEATWIEPTALPNVEGPTAAQWQFVHDAMVGVTAEPRGTAHGAMQGTAYKVAGKRRVRRALQRARREHRSSASPGAALRGRLGRVLRVLASPAALSADVDAVGVLFRYSAADRGRDRGRDRQGRTALARLGASYVPAVRALEA